MEPIKVDFSGRNGSHKGDIVIPPEKAVLKRILALILTAVTAVAAYYFMLPPLNFKAYELYLYIAIVAVSYIVFSAIFSKAITLPEYTPYLKKRAIVPGIILAILAVAVGVGYLVSCEFFRAKSYSNIITVNSGDFANEIEEQRN